MVVVSVALRSAPAFAAASVVAASEALRSAASEGVRLAEAAFRGVGIAGPGFRGPVRVAGFRGGGFRRGWGGWGLPLAGLGLGLGYYGYSSYYSDPCVVWDGYTWVDACY